MQEDSKKLIWYAIPVVVVAALGVALYYGRKQSEEVVAPTVKTEPPPVVPPAAHHPIESANSSLPPLPPLAESDARVQQSIIELFGESLRNRLVPKETVRNFVVTIDNLPRKKTAVPRWPLKPTGGQLVTNGGDDAVLSAENAVRYAPMIQLLQSADIKQVAASYKYLYPLMQQAYVDLGYPDGYFNNRMIEVIDHLLATPEVSGPIRLEQPGVFYQFADPSLEERSAGQKLMIRMGNDNAAVIKARLTELRREIAQPQP